MAAADERRDEALERLGAALMALFASHRRLRGRDARIEDGVSFAHYQLLRVLAEKGELSARQLAAEAALAPASVTQMLDALAAAGVVERTRSESDRRVVTTRLTDAGRRKVERKQEELAAKWLAALEDLAVEDVEGAERVIGRLGTYLDEL